MEGRCAFRGKAGRESVISTVRTCMGSAFRARASKERRTTTGSERAEASQPIFRLARNKTSASLYSRGTLTCWMRSLTGWF